MDGNLSMANSIVNQTEGQANNPNYPNGTDLKNHKEIGRIMKPGNLVLHIKTGILLRILEIYESTAICEYVDKPVGWITMKPCVTLKSVHQISESTRLMPSRKP